MWTRSLEDLLTDTPVPEDSSDAEFRETAVRTTEQRRRSFKFQDFFDLRHAAAAIPYCDVFLTEKFMKTACTSNLLDLDTVHDTHILSDEDEALDAVSRIG